MIKISFSPKFIKMASKLEEELVEEIYEKINLLKNPANHKQLKVHKLHGKHSDRYSFYVNYKIRIVFKYISKKEVALLVVGGHEIYN